MLKEFIQEVANNGLDVYGIRVIKNGELIAGHDFAPDIRYPLYSATKSFTSTAVGLALEETRLSLDHSILSYLEEYVPKSTSMEVVEGLSKITLQRLLTMSVSGYPFRPEGEDWLANSLSILIPDISNIIFNYSNIPAYLAGVIVEKVVGENLVEYLKPRILHPLEIMDPVYQVCPAGHFYGATGMYLTVEELSRLGQLYLQQGLWKGRLLLSPKWVKEATAKQIDTREGGYGYFFWRFQENGYRISGKCGQCCYVFPDKDLIIAHMANIQDDAKTKILMNLVFGAVYNKFS